MYYRGEMVTRVSGLPWGILSIFIFSALPKISTVADFVPTDKVDQSICKQHHRITASQTVSYTETYDSWDYGYHQLKTRVNYKTQQITKWKSVEMCCQGYEPHKLADDAENCVPVCLSDCSNGVCNRPNECLCNSGYIVSINNSTGFSECHPNCSSGCHGGICIEPETCSCNTGYTPAEDQRSCKASCIGVHNCTENAICVAPDTCKCDIGYIPQTAYSHLMLDNSTFNNNNVTCKPLCKPECAENAHCIAPDKCQCNKGYTEASIRDEPIKCLPVCEQNCINSFCSTPNTCTCFEGYKPHDLLGKNFCEPVCQNECINGKCTQPNQCECAIGYEKLVTTSGRNQTISENVCVPVCPGNCYNGRCVAPGQCHCNEGYVLKSKSTANETKPENSCQPNCEPNCLSGSICVAPNQCQIKYNDYKILDRWPKFSTRIVNNTDDCGSGRVSKKNDKTGCVYKLNDTECYEPNPCAIILIDKTTIINHHHLMALQSIFFVTNEKNISNWYGMTNSEHDQKFNWRKPKCTKECRILIASENEPEVVYEHDIFRCYLLELLNKTTGLLLLSKSLPTLLGLYENRTSMGIGDRYPAICLLENDSIFNETTFMKTESAVESNVRTVVFGIIGTAITLALIIGLGVLFYRSRQKFSRIRHSRGVSASNDTMMERSEVGHFSTGEHL